MARSFITTGSASSRAEKPTCSFLYQALVAHPRREVPFSMVKNAAQVSTVTQADLEELLYLRDLLVTAHERWLRKREDVRLALEAGGNVEDGVHWVVLLQHTKTGEPIMVR